MTGVEEVLLDANVLLRLLTGEPEAMAARAEALFERAAGGELRLILTPLMVAECVWVLKSFYRQPLSKIGPALQQVLAAPGLRTLQQAQVVEALDGMVRHNVDFADAFLAELSRDGNQWVATFDRDLKKLGVEVLTP